jgi:hypothetical protein
MINVSSAEVAKKLPQFIFRFKKKVSIEKDAESRQTFYGVFSKGSGA